MTRSRHDEHFARLWSEQAAKRGRWTTGVQTTGAVVDTETTSGGVEANTRANCGIGDAMRPRQRGIGASGGLEAGVAPGPLTHQRAPADTAASGRATAGVAGAPIYPLVNLCRAANLPIPTPEWQFHDARKWQFDYAWPLHKIALEIEGGIWKKGGGAHSHPLNIVRDCEKYSEAAILGWRILRVPPEKLRTLGMEYLFRIFGEKRNV